MNQEIKNFFLYLRENDKEKLLNGGRRENFQLIKCCEEHNKIELCECRSSEQQF